MLTVKNIVFDFGNVLFDLDLAAFERNLQAVVGPGRLAAAKSGLKAQRIFELYETGGLSTEEFVGHLCCACGPELRPEDAVSAWNSIFIGMPAHRFEMLLALRQRHRVFLLSNINEMHEHWIAGYMEREHGLRDYEARYFDGVYFSHLVRLRKPDLEIFEYVLADAELKAGETVFFDDLPENVAAAEQTGIRGIWHPVGHDIGEHLRRLGLLA